MVHTGCLGNHFISEHPFILTLKTFHHTTETDFYYESASLAYLQNKIDFPVKNEPVQMNHRNLQLKEFIIIQF